MNPFTTQYHPDFFCNRENEIQRLRENLTNGLNTLIHSPRRLGKSALIRHLFHRLEKEGEYETIFIDLFATSNTEDLLRLMAENILKKYHSKNFLRGIQTLLKGISPTVSFSQDGTPSLSLSLKEGTQETTLNQLFNFLEGRKKKVVIAFDEFQEIAGYPEKAEALLRTYIQQLSNIKFIFSGSTNHILQNMFYGPNRPFYQSTEVIVLDKINYDVYFQFIDSCFQRYSKNIENEATRHILEFTDGYTYYTQVICNQAFYKTEEFLTFGHASEITNMYIENRKIDYLNLFNLLAQNQKRLAIAIAKKGIVEKPSSIEFLMQYHLPSASSAMQAINTLHQKEIIYKGHNGYMIYDVFFKRFLQKYF